MEVSPGTPASADDNSCRTGTNVGGIKGCPHRINTRALRTLPRPLSLRKSILLYTAQNKLTYYYNYCLPKWNLKAILIGCFKEENISKLNFQREYLFTMVKR